VGITIYGTPPSPPSHSVRLMAERKGIDHKMVWLLPGLWALSPSHSGFRGATVPAMKIDGPQAPELQGDLAGAGGGQAGPPTVPRRPGAAPRGRGGRALG